MKKTLLIATAITCFAFTSKKEYNTNYIEVVNTLEDMQEWLVADIKNEELSKQVV